MIRPRPHLLSVGLSPVHWHQQPATWESSGGPLHLPLAGRQSDKGNKQEIVEVVPHLQFPGNQLRDSVLHKTAS